MTGESQWRRCSACKQPIRYGAEYWVCSVSTCNRKRTGLAFCSVSCWEVHLPVARHREAWAEERTAPAGAAADPEAKATGSTPRDKKRILPPAQASRPEPRAAAPREVLIVASRLKDYVKARSGFNTSERVLEPLSEIVRKVCDEAIANAERDGRRTILDRDIPR